MKFTDANADSWYAFCVEQSHNARDRGDSAAALVWWCIRMIDDAEIGDPEDPCTEAGYLELSEYYSYKLASA